MRQMQQMQMKQEALEQQVKNDRKKEENQSFAKTWENCAKPETHDSIAYLKVKLEKPKQADIAMDYIQMLRGLRDAREADSSNKVKHKSPTTEE